MKNELDVLNAPYSPDVVYENILTGNNALTYQNSFLVDKGYNKVTIRL